MGLYGLAITELLIVILAIIPVVMYKEKFSQVFPVKRPKIRHVSGSLLIWSGTYLVVMLVTQATMYFFPEGFLNVSDNISNMTASTPVLVSFIIVALMPAICEEMLHRGFIQYTSRTLGIWQRIILMGFLFGLFHLDPYRFLPTAILGMAFTYAMIKTENILIPMLMHLVNNSLAVFSAFVEVETVVPTASQISLSIGTFFILSAFVPFILLFGVKLLNQKGAKTFTKLKTGFAILISVSCIFAGGLIFSGHAINNDPLFNTNISMGVSHKSPPHILPFTGTTNQINGRGHNAAYKAIIEIIRGSMPS